MNKPPRAIQILVWGGLIIIIVAIAVAFVRTEILRPQPRLSPLPLIGTVADFALTNQQAQPVRLADLQGKVWVADIIFTRCPGPCARMTRQLAEIQAALPTTSSARLVSLTTDAEFDTPSVLQRYAEKTGAQAQRWSFLTGDPHAIANLAIDSLKLTALEKPAAERTSPEDLFIHSTIFVIVDKHARLRGVFDTAGEDGEWARSKRRILTAIEQLENEP